MVAALSAATITTDVVAVVNSVAIYADDLVRAAATDQVMSVQLGLDPATDRATVLDRVVNLEVARQAAQAVGVSLPVAQSQQALAALVAQHDVTSATLQSALAAAGVEFPWFETYFYDLLLTSQFVSSRAAANGLAPDAVIRNLQTAAQISWGPAATIDLSPQLAPVAVATPAPTATVVDKPAVADLPVGTQPGFRAPDFALAQVDGPEITLDDLLGAPAVLSFWATWCPYCERQTPLLVAAHARYAAQGIRFIGIDVRESADPVRAYLMAHAVPYENVLDTEGIAAQQYQVSGFPTTYFLDRTGQIVARHIGQLSEDQIDGYLAQLLTDNATIQP